MERELGKLSGQLNQISKTLDKLADLSQETRDKVTEQGATLKNINKEVERYEKKLTDIEAAVNSNKTKIAEIETKLNGHADDASIHADMQATVGRWTARALWASLSATAGAAGLAIWEYFRR